MASSNPSVLSAALAQQGSQLLEPWLAAQAESASSRLDLIPEPELRQQSRELLGLVADAVGRGGADSFDAPVWEPTRQLLASISESRAMQGFTPSETAMFVMSLKQPLFTAIRAAVTDAKPLGDELWRATRLFDQMALYTTEVHLQSRERFILRQREDLLELSTPVIKLWEGILALPMIGTLDSTRTQVVMEALLQRIVETGAEVAIIDITGVPTVDTLVAQHLIKTVTAARLMGADCIISGIRPQIAATIVHLGVDLSDIATKSTLADAFRLALRRIGHPLGRPPATLTKG